MRTTGISDRMEAARKALAWYEARKERGYGTPQSGELADALRALIEPPATVETPEKMAEAWRENLYQRGTIEILGGYPLERAGDGGKPWQEVYSEAYRQGINAGIQAAWESWEPEA